MLGKLPDHIKTMLLLIAVSLGYIVYQAAYAWLWIPGLLLLITLLPGPLAERVHVLWMKLGHYLGIITTPVVLTLVFFLVLTPLALLARLRNKDVLTLKKNKKSMFKTEEKIFVPVDFENPW